MKIHFLPYLLLIVLVMSSCTIDVNQPPVETPASQSAPPLPSTQMPVTWASLNLTGKLVYLNGEAQGDVFSLQVRVLDLVTGGVSTIFDAPKYSWIYYVTVSPDNKQVLMSYSPPPADNATPDQDLYVLPVDGSKPLELLFTPPAREDDYIEADWSPDGKYVYFTHVNFQIPPQDGQIYPLYEIYRMQLPNGQTEKVAEKAYWPRLSPDSSQITYISVDLFSRVNKLYVADADGSNAHQVVLEGTFVPDIKDAPMFSADGKSILFSANLPTQSYQPNWLDKLMGVLVVKAHGNVISDWWSVPVAGGTITRLTNIQSMGLFASLSPDKQHIASYSNSGIFVMKPDGTEVTSIVPNPQNVPGTVWWIP